MLPNTVTESDISTWAPRAHPLTYIGLAAYALLVAVAIRHHEPWADEAQSWLLGRDATLAELWGHLLHYEGTPGLWQTLLHAVMRLGLPYSGYGFVSGSLALVAVYLLRYAPLPLTIRLLLPFTYYLCYQYAVIARSYVLIAPLLFAIAAIYNQAVRKPAWMMTLLALLAGVSVHGLLLSICIWLSFEAGSSANDRSKRAIPTAFYFCAVILFVVFAWPTKDVAFAEHRGLSNLHLLPAVTKAGLAGAFAGHWMASLALLALSWPFLWRGGGWLFFVLASLSFCLFGSIVYAQLWHFGILFLAWLFAIWISAYKTPVTQATILALVIAIGIQCYWTAAAIHYDWSHAYSGSVAASEYLKQTGLPRGGLYAIGYPTTAIQPYFSSNIYSNFHDGSYWDWSKRNTADDPAALFASDRREWVMVGYKVPAERQRWADLLALLGYGLTQHFEGRTFWQTRVFEDESYDLYRKTSDPSASSRVNMADPAQSAQLLNGFYNVEGGKSRWTAKTFSVLLKAPPGSDENGAELTLKLYLPDVQFRNLGPITMTADADGQILPALTLSKPEEYIYPVHVPAQALKSGFVVVHFRLDKSSIGLNGDARELGVVSTEVNLAPPSPAP